MERYALVYMVDDLSGDLHLQHGARHGQGPGRQRMDDPHTGISDVNHVLVLPYLY